MQKELTAAQLTAKTRAINMFSLARKAGKLVAGMDMVKVREKYGKTFCIKGGIDKFALLRGKDAIRDELVYKTCETMRHGGTVFGLDHRIPNGVTIENYRYYVNLAREMLGIPPIENEGWERMAF